MQSSVTGPSSETQPAALGIEPASSKPHTCLQRAGRKTAGRGQAAPKLPGQLTSALFLSHCLFLLDFIDLWGQRFSTPAAHEKHMGNVYKHNWSLIPSPKHGLSWSDMGPQHHYFLNSPSDSNMQAGLRSLALLAGFHYFWPVLSSQTLFHIHLPGPTVCIHFFF